MAMLDAGFDPAVVDGNGRTLLHYLSWLDHVSVLPRPLAAGLPINRQDKDGSMALHLAAHRRAEGVMASLVLAGANTSIVNNDGEPPVLNHKPWRYAEATFLRISR